MRKDIGKAVTERPRVGGGGMKFPRHKTAKNVKILENWPSFEGVKKPHGYNTKSFTDVLAPIKGLLRKSVGRRWDSVYSELCQGLDKSKHTHQHVLDHVKGYVVTSTVFLDGEVKYLEESPWSGDKKGYQPISEYGSYRGDVYYVHPKSGILFAIPPKETKQQVTQRKAEAAKKKLQVVRRINQVTWAVFDEKHQVWYKWIAKEVPPLKPIKYEMKNGKLVQTGGQEPYRQVGFPKLPKGYSIEGFNEKKQYMAEKKTLSKKEKKVFGII